MLSPQHWSQSSTNDKGGREGTWCGTYYNQVRLHWNSNQYHRTVTLDPATNVACIRSAPGSTKFAAFKAECDEANLYPDPVCFLTNIVLDDEDLDSEADKKFGVNLPYDLDDNLELWWAPDEFKKDKKLFDIANVADKTTDPNNIITFHDVPANGSVVEPDEEEVKLTPTAQLLKSTIRWLICLSLDSD